MLWDEETEHVKFLKYVSLHVCFGFLYTYVCLAKTVLVVNVIFISIYWIGSGRI